MESPLYGVVNNLNAGTFGKERSDLGSAGSTKPKAYLNVMFFDERMHYVAEGSASQRVQIAGDGVAPLALLNIKVPKNGYCMVFVSNESGEYVYFDDMIVRHDCGRILEQNHYYAFGLKIATLSSRAFGAPSNGFFSSTISAVTMVGCPGVSGLASIGYSAISTISSLASSFFTVLNITVRSINDGNINTGRPNSLKIVGNGDPIYMEPQYFDAPDEAAAHFAFSWGQYAGQSPEYGAIIYKVNVDGKTKYAYEVFRGTSAHGNDQVILEYSLLKRKPKVKVFDVVGYIHTHPDTDNFSKKAPKDEIFNYGLDWDMMTHQQNIDKDFYLVTPDGYLIVNRGYRSIQGSNFVREDYDEKDDKKKIDNRSFLLRGLKTKKNKKPSNKGVKFQEGKWRDVNDRIVPNGKPRYMEKYFRSIKSTIKRK